MYAPLRIILNPRQRACLLFFLLSFGCVYYIRVRFMIAIVRHDCVYNTHRPTSREISPTCSIIIIIITIRNIIIIPIIYFISHIHSTAARGLLLDTDRLRRWVKLIYGKSLPRGIIIMVCGTLTFDCDIINGINVLYNDGGKIYKHARGPPRVSIRPCDKCVHR